MVTKFIQILFLRYTIYTNIFYKVTKFIHDYYCFLFLLFYCMLLYKGKSLNWPCPVFQLHSQGVGGVETNCSTNNCLESYNCTMKSLVGPEPNVWSFIQFWLTRMVPRHTRRVFVKNVADNAFTHSLVPVFTYHSTPLFSIYFSWVCMRDPFSIPYLLILSQTVAH